MKFTEETKRANCSICTLASCMKDCRSCPFFGIWAETKYVYIPPISIVKITLNS